MKTMRLKKLLFALVAMFLSTTAWAEDLVAWNDYSTDGVKHFRWFVFSDGRLELSAGADMGDGEIPALSDSPFLSYKDQISKLVVNNGIKNLPTNLFLDIPLVTVDLTGAGDLTDITMAFFGNEELETVYLGNKITTIGNSAFYDCKALTTIVESTETAYLTKVTSIGDYAFSDCEALKTIQLVHSNPVNVGKNAFSGCTSLESFVAFNVGSVDGGAFSDCTSLKGFTGGLSGPTSIGNEAFRGCTSLEYCTAVSGLTSLGLYAFKDCTSLKYLDFRTTSLGGYWDRASRCSDIPDAAIIYLPAGCTVVGHNMVAGETCPDFRLYEGSEYKGIKSFTANKVTYERTMAADKLYTICLPYVYKNAAWKYYQIDKVADNTITFKEIDQESLAADEPYLVSTGTAGVSNLNTTVATAISGGYGVTKTGDFEFRGTFKEISNEYLTGETKNFYILQTDKSWKKVTTTDKTAYVPPFRGYIGTNKAVGARELMIDFEDDVTGVKQIKTVGLDGTEQYYDLSGRRLSQPKKGINIVNGRKVIIK